MELEYFSSFQFFESDVRSLAFDQTEAPDFRTTEVRPSIGIEVTRLFRRGARPDMESSKDRILDDARSIAEVMNLPPADVTLFFSFEGTVAAADRLRIAKGAVEVIAANMPSEGAHTHLEYCTGQPPEVDLILINRVHCGVHGEWRWLEAGKVEYDVFGLIDAAIGRKSDKLEEYLKACDECWLLLVGDSFRPSGKLAIDKHGAHQEFESPFSRTYFLDFGRGQLHRLKTSVRAP